MNWRELVELLSIERVFLDLRNERRPWKWEEETRVTLISDEPKFVPL